VSTSELVNDPTAPTVEWRGLKGVRGVSEADVTAPTDPVSVEPMTECYDATRPKNTPHRPRVGGRNDWMLQRCQ